MKEKKRVLMVAAENDALPGAKVGGVGDVIRDLPKALNKKGLIVDTVIPSYGFLARLKTLELTGVITVQFASNAHSVEIFRMKNRCGKGDHYILHHPIFYNKGEQIYINNVDEGPFATDATKFAFFCTCVAQALVKNSLPKPNVLHCHDWHTAFLLILIRFGLKFVSLRKIKTAYTIHNLAIQGIRPFDSDESSLKRWFPELRFSIDKISDPRFPDCVNPMRAGILLADRINTVSPSYAKEILHGSHPEMGIHGGEGLENDLRQRADRDDVAGILNGCEYPPGLNGSKVSRSKLVKMMLAAIELSAARNRFLTSAHWLAEKKITNWNAHKAEKFTVTSVGRMTEQKMRILLTTLSSGKSALQGLLDSLGSYGTLIILGNGDSQLEDFVAETSAANTNLIFLNTYSGELSQELYKFGDLFLMPSSFEPCGISQMLAMRVGQPCLANSVGGLRDTVKHGENGFLFSGETVVAQAEALVQEFNTVLSIFKKDKNRWRQISKAASEARFSWEKSAKQYIDELY